MALILNDFDVIIKDEGSFFNVTFQSEKSKKFAKELCVKLDEDNCISVNRKVLKDTKKILNKTDLSFFEF